MVRKAGLIVNDGKELAVQTASSVQKKLEKSNFEVLCIDQDINFSHLRGTVLTFLKTFFGDIPVRFRASYFPFTEPSAEVDVQWKGKWLEVMGCGMVDPKVLEK